MNKEIEKTEQFWNDVNEMKVRKEVNKLLILSMNWKENSIQMNNKMMKWIFYVWTALNSKSESLKSPWKNPTLRVKFYSENINLWYEISENSCKIWKL